MAEAFVRSDEHPACGICPSRRLPLGEFDVQDRPSDDCPFDPADGHRYTRSGVPVCVHPHKVGIPTGRYKSDGVPLTGELELPGDVAELESYLRGVLHSAAPGMLELLIEQAATEIPRAFPGVDVVTTLRRALG
ncbi:hypothetical protein FHS39_000924 [Streptomyces olivoverticillatus]|uniref:Uncharacterized protein n=1 Tax=Streptomyces olivoverticillatus TaxID=66427 RepID=A0A7W7LKI3_9ACTN|nr:hypothetical protein [Streptomyces olivoverticillatus]MBB4891924.1 hypothetical protein [Streptomyces olivoverticillatus]